MPTCKQCSVSFPNRIVIDGKSRVISNRKYCLDCSPFGKHNTRKIHIPVRVGGKLRDDIITLSCAGCERTYDVLPEKDRGKYCGSCIVARKRKHRKSKCVNYLGGRCIRCGYDKCPSALKFHHVNEKTKKFTVAGSECRRWEAVEKEIRKCILVCGNCHDEIHWFKIDVTDLFKEFWRTAQVSGGDL